MSDNAKKAAIAAFVVLNLGLAGAAWIKGSSAYMAFGGADAWLIVFGRLFGLIFQLVLLTQLVLIGRIAFVERTFGFDKLNRAHRTLGYAFLASVLLHPLLITWGYALAGRATLPAQFIEFWQVWPNVAFAVCGLFLFIVAGVASIPKFRKMMKYGNWHLAHLLMYGGVGLVFWHQFNSEDLSAAPYKLWWQVLNFGIWTLLVFNRFAWPFIMYARHRFRVASVMPETSDVVSILISGREMERFRYEPGQYVHVSFQAKGFREPHPFSLSKAPDGQSIRLSIKNSGDFTSRMKDLPVGTKVLLEGPFGKFTEEVARGERYLFIAGGIGITPIRSMLEDLAKKGADAILIYANKTPGDMVFAKELETIGVRRYDVFSNADVPGAEKGFVDIEKISRLVPDYAGRDIYVCGPPVMMDKIIAALREKGVPRSKLHFEKFAY